MSVRDFLCGGEVVGLDIVENGLKIGMCIDCVDVRSIARAIRYMYRCKYRSCQQSIRAYQILSIPVSDYLKFKVGGIIYN
jgi:hypothetical protein